MYLGYALRQMAREFGLEIQDGVVCGIFEGYAVSMWEGISGTKSFSISAKFDDDIRKKLKLELGELEYKYNRLEYLGFVSGVENALTAVFFDNPGTMKQFRNCFLDVLTILEHYDIPDADICPKCGLPMYGQGVWSMYEMMGTKTCLYVHEHCAAAVEREVNRQLEIGNRPIVSKEQFILDFKELYPKAPMKEIEEAYQEIKAVQTPVKRYLPGWIGALGGCILSIILFVVILLFFSDSHNGRSGGLLACIGGLIIKKGYDITGDTHGKKRCLTIIILTVVYVFLGTFGAITIQNAIELNQFHMIPEGISIIEKCQLYLYSGIRTVVLDKIRFLIPFIIFTVISLLVIYDVIRELYYGDDGCERMRRKHLRKRK